VTTDLRSQLQSTLGDGYTLERELGGGGMSRVFVARENALGREVVVKVLAPELSASVSAERFTREIATAARLQQANIVPVLAAGTSDGVPYYTMPYVKGESLRAQMARGIVLSMHDRLNVLRDVARALAYAHGEGVIHRDIKPDNVLLSAGTAVVTDFGIAKAISAARTHDGPPASTNDGTLTQAGSSIGTPAYMAPEQAVGDAVDHRADLYAWGVVAYELLSGAHPFAGKTGTSQLIAAHLTETPVSLDARSPEVPREVVALVMQCLAKHPGDRPASAQALLEQLATVSTPSSERAAASTGAASGKRSLTLVAAALVLVAGAAALWSMNGRGGDSDTRTSAAAGAPTESLSSLAVLPFVNTSGDAKDEYFSDGLTDELAHALSKLPGLRLAGRSSSFSFKGKTILASDVGKALGVGAIVEGTVRRAGDRIRLTAQLTSTRDGQVLWSDAFERTGADVFAVQDAFTSAIVAALTPRLAQGAGVIAQPNQASVAARGTTDAVAYDLYLKGRYYWAQRGAGPLDSAVKYLEAAVQRDSTFARGWAALALAYVIRPNFNADVDFAPSDAKAEIAARRALALDSTSADAHAAVGFAAIRQFDFEKSATSMATARRLDPASAIAAHWSAIAFHVLGDTAQADQQMERALTLDPLSPTTFNTRSRMLSERRQFVRALENDARAAQLSTTFLINSAQPLIWAGLADSAFRVTKRAPASDRNRGRLGYAIMAAAAAGEWDAARALQRQIAARGPDVRSFDRAVAALVFSDRATAATLFVDHLEHDGALANLAFSVCYPPYDGIRAEPAWKAFLARHQLKECPYTSPWPIGPAPVGPR
jgi:serine/threonine-protein kinase